MVFESNLHGGHGIVRGDSFPVRRTIIRIPPSVLIESAWLTVKGEYDTPDASATFQITIDPTETPSGQILDTGESGIGDILFQVSEGNTLSMAADIEYYYDIQIRLSNGNVRTIERGVTSALEQVTANS